MVDAANVQSTQEALVMLRSLKEADKAVKKEKAAEAKKRAKEPRVAHSLQPRRALRLQRIQ